MVRELKPGMVGDDVLEVKNGLHHLGYMDEVDEGGYFSQNMKLAVKEFQKDAKLPRTGIVDGETRKALSRELAAKG